MSTGTDAAGGGRKSALFGDLRENWGWLLAFGILSVVLGLVGLGGVAGLSVVSVLFIGTLILIDGGDFRVILVTGRG